MDDVWAALLKYNDYSKWSCFQNYRWQAQVDEDGAPPVGATGWFKVFFDIFITVLDLHISFTSSISRLSQGSFGCDVRESRHKVLLKVVDLISICAWFLRNSTC